MKKVTLPELDAMSMKPSHTPTFQMPLIIARDKAGQKVWINDANGESVARTEEETNAAYIVKCVNAHEGLVKACKAVLRQANTYCTDQETGETPYELVKQALAQAEGK